MTGKLIIVPNGEIRSMTKTEKGGQYATIYSGKFEIVATVTDAGKIQVSREVVETMFEIIEEDEPSRAERLGVTEDDLNEAGV